MLTTMSKSELKSRAKARRAASMAGKSDKHSNKTDANIDTACRHCGTNINRRGLRTHERHCHDNPMNMKQPAKTVGQHKETKKNKRTN